MQDRVSYGAAQRELATLEPIERERLAALLERPGFAGKLEPELVATFGTDFRDVAAVLLPVAREYARAEFCVGAIAEGSGGAVYLGANLELPGAPLGWTLHAEQSAVVGALVHGEKTLRRLAATATPCGHCRQFLKELDCAAELEILLPDGRSADLAGLLPSAFGPSDLGLKAALLADPAWRLRDVRDGMDGLLHSALKALRQSYAPYSRSPSAIALETADGVIVGAPYIENAAYNPSVPPAIAALDRLRFEPAAGPVSKAILVEVEGARIDQYPMSTAVLGIAAPEVNLAIREFGLEG